MGRLFARPARDPHHETRDVLRVPRSLVVRGHDYMSGGVGRIGRLRRFGRSQRPPLSCYLTGWKEKVAVTLVPVSLMLLAVTPE